YSPYRRTPQAGKGHRWFRGSAATLGRRDSAGRAEGGAGSAGAPAGGGGGRPAAGGGGGKLEPARGGSGSLDQPPGAGPVVGGRAIDGGPTAAVRNPWRRRRAEPARPPRPGRT